MLCDQSTILHLFMYNTGCKFDQIRILYNITEWVIRGFFNYTCFLQAEKGIFSLLWSSYLFLYSEKYLSRLEVDRYSMRNSTLDFYWLLKGIWKLRISYPNVVEYSQFLFAFVSSNSFHKFLSNIELNYCIDYLSLFGIMSVLLNIWDDFGTFSI